MTNSQRDFTFGYIMGGVYALGAAVSLVYGMRVGSDVHRDVIIVSGPEGRECANQAVGLRLNCND